MDLDSPDVAKEFPGLYASDSMKRSQSYGSDYSDNEKSSKKDKDKKKEKKESKKDKGYVAFEEESSGDDAQGSKSPGKSKKRKLSSFKFRGADRKEKNNKSKDKEVKEKKEEKEKNSKKENKDVKDKDIDKSTSKKKKSKLAIIKDKKKKLNSENSPEVKPIFGVPLHVAIERSKSHDGIELPIVVRECIDYIEDHGLSCEGIYRISGLKSKLSQLKSQYNRSEKVYLYEHEPHIVANLLKLFLHDLPEPILTTELTPHFEEAAVIKNSQKRLEILQDLINKLPNCNRVLLSWIIVHMLHVAALEKRNKMNLQNISIKLSPTLKINHYILHAFFAHSEILFKGVELKKYVPPVELDSSRLSAELPDSPSAIAKELSKQENVLSILHDELKSGVRDKTKEEELWEIQRIVTQLKRKLRYVSHMKNTSIARSEAMQKGNEVQKAMDVKLAEMSAINASKRNDDTEINTYSQNATEKNLSSKIHETAECGSMSEKKNLNILQKPLKNSLSLKEESSVDENIPVKATVPKSISEHVLSCHSSPAKQHISKVTDEDSENNNERTCDLPHSASEYVTNENISTEEVTCAANEEDEINTNDKLDILHEDSRSSNEKNMQDLSLSVETMIKCSDNETFLKEISRYTVHENDSTSPCEFENNAEEKYFAAQLYLNILGDELILLRNDLKRKKNSEVFEIERLKQEINESLHLLKYKQYSFDSAPLLISSSSTENSSSNSDHSSASDGEEDECDPQSILTELIEENIQLKSKSQEFLKSIEKEREKNVNVKVLMKMLQTVRRLKTTNN